MEKKKKIVYLTYIILSIITLTFSFSQNHHEAESMVELKKQREIDSIEFVKSDLFQNNKMFYGMWFSISKLLGDDNYEFNPFNNLTSYKEFKNHLNKKYGPFIINSLNYRYRPAIFGVHEEDKDLFSFHDYYYYSKDSILIAIISFNRIPNKNEYNNLQQFAKNALFFPAFRLRHIDDTLNVDSNLRRAHASITKLLEAKEIR